MVAFLKKIVIFAIVVGVGWFIMAHHFIIVDGPVPLMFRKGKLTLQYTIVSTKGKELSKVMAIQELWDDGIGREFVKAGMITEDEYQAFKAKMEGTDYY